MGQLGNRISLCDIRERHNKGLYNLFSTIVFINQNHEAPGKRGYRQSRYPGSPRAALLAAEEALGERRDEANLDQQADDRLYRRDGRLWVAGLKLFGEEAASMERRQADNERLIPGEMRPADRPLDEEGHREAHDDQQVGDQTAPGTVAVARQ